jgi:hypothetical protein
LEADGIATSHPLSIGRPVQKLSEIDNWFDDIEYNKGGAVLRMLRAWLNRADAPMLGLDFGASSSSSGGSGARQHARRLQQTLSEYLPDSPMVEAGRSSSSKDGRWWQQQQQKGPHDVAGTSQPLLPTLLPTLLPAADRLESGSAAAAADDASTPPVTATDSSSSSGSGSNAWWTKRAHIGGASAILAQQAKGSEADAAAGGAAAAVAQREPLQVLPAGTDGGVATVGFEGLAGLETVGEKDSFVKGLRTYVQVRYMYANAVCYCVCLISRLGAVFVCVLGAAQLLLCAYACACDLQSNRAGVRSLTGGVATVGFEGLSGLASGWGEQSICDGVADLCAGANMCSFVCSCVWVFMCA